MPVPVCRSVAVSVARKASAVCRLTASVRLVMVVADAVTIASRLMTIASQLAMVTGVPVSVPNGGCGRRACGRDNFFACRSKNKRMRNAWLSAFFAIFVQNNIRKTKMMNRFFALVASFVVTVAAFGSEKPERVLVETPHLSLVIDLYKERQPRYVYFGQRLDRRDVDRLPVVKARLPLYPEFGQEVVHEAAFAMTHADGNMTTELRYVGKQITEEPNAVLTVINLRDKIYPTELKLCYRAYADVDIIEAWVEIENKEAKTVTLRRFASAFLPIRTGEVWISRLHGAWGNECVLVEEPLDRGIVMIKNKNGVRNSQTEHAEVMFSLNGKGRENEGDVIGAALCYTGNYKLQVETYNADYHYFMAGINEENSEYHLRSGEKFVTPPLALTYSSEGKGGVSRTFHKWGRKYSLCHGDQVRDVLLNSWEGVYMDVEARKMDKMMADFKALGGEMFVMDDGWFGGKYQRTDDAALGDWVADKRKLPGGIEGLLKDARKNGVKFGIWIEPEMTNIKSELYERHPDWVINGRGRDLVGGRGSNQLVLDLSNPAVQDFVYGVVDNLLTRYPQIVYIKWDANMSIMSYGSRYQSAGNQSHIYIGYHEGLRKVYERIRAKYPDVIMQSCASGGGRVNWGYLKYFDEFWVSDDTDALQRIYMQWGTSHFFPAICMASHVSALRNHQTYRHIPIKYRFDVAMSGRLGMEMQPESLSADELEFARNAIADYKTIRPVVQLGNLYRLISPFDNRHVASLMYVSDSKDKAAFFWWKLVTFVDDHLPRVRMAGLDPQRMYRIRELNRIDDKPLFCEGVAYSGAYLMNHGLDMPAEHVLARENRIPWSSRVLYLEAE